MRDQSLTRQPAVATRYDKRAVRNGAVMNGMTSWSAEWITIAAYENLPGRLRSMAAVRT